MTRNRWVDPKSGWAGLACLVALVLFGVAEAGAVTVPNTGQAQTAAQSLLTSAGLYTVTVPNVTGQALTAAQSLLASAGLYAEVTLTCSDDVPVDGVISQDPAAGATVAIGTTVTLSVSNGPCTIQVPDVVGMAGSAAQAALAALGLYVTVEIQCDDAEPVDNVISQDPAAGAQVNIGSSVTIVVSSGPCSLIPNVIGYPEQQARLIIESSGFFISSIERQCSDLIALGDVAVQIPAGGALARTGSGVALIIANGRCTSAGGGSESILVPAIVGLTEEEASSRIRAAGLEVGEVTRVCTSSVTAGVVMSQSPAPLTPLAPSGAVTFAVSAGPCVVVPDVVGKDQSEAITILTDAGLTVGTVTPQCQTSGSDDVVLAQSMAAGTQVIAETAVNLTVSDTTCVTVPEVIGLTPEAAGAVLATVNLYLNVTEAACGEVTTDGVLSQTPIAGTLVSLGSTVDVVISSGPCPITVPNVLGKTAAEARSLLQAAGLIAEVESECNNRVQTGSVIRQVPLPNATVDPGSQVTIYTSSGKCPVIIPSVIGLSYDDARSELINAGIDPANILVTKQFQSDIPANQVISQTPAPETEVSAETVVTLLISRGEKPPAPDNATIKEVLYNGFVLADRNNDGKLTFEEVLDVLPGLTQDVFNTIDTNGDGAITREELARFLRIGGCFGCLRGLWPFKMIGGDLLLLGVSLMTLAAASARRVER